jgi:hypothetical protein
LVTADIHKSCLAWDELACRGVPIQIREPAWSRLLSWTNWPSPKYEKATLTLRERLASPPAGRIRFQSANLVLVEDQER